MTKPNAGRATRSPRTSGWPPPSEVAELLHRGRGQGVVLAASGLVTLPYTCTFASAPAGTGTGTVAATVTWDPSGEAATASVGATTAGSFEVTSETNRTVAVVDDTTVPGQRVVLDPSVTWSPGR